MKKHIAPLFFTLLNDLLGAGVVLTLFAPLLLGSDDFFSLRAPYSIRAITLGLLISMYPLGQFFGAPFMGELSDHYGRKQPLRLTILGSFIAFLLSGYSILIHSLALMFFSRLLAGLFSANRSLAQAAIIDRATPKNQKMLLIWTTFFIGVGFVLGPYLGGKLSESRLVSWFDFDVPFIFVAALFLINFFWIFFTYKDTFRPVPHKKFEIKSHFKHILLVYKERPLGVLFSHFFIANLGGLIFISFLPAFLFEVYKYRQGMIGDIMGYYAFFFAIGPILLHRLFIHVKPEHLIFTPLIVYAILMYSILHFIDHWALWALLPFAGAALAIYWTASFMLFSKYTTPHIRGKVFGIAWSNWSLAYFFSTACAGLLLSHGPEVPIACGAVITLVAAFVYLLFFKPHKSILED
jgi:DHA1 family tetracycline resistance protein-like MFS transporter